MDHVPRWLGRSNQAQDVLCTSYFKDAASTEARGCYKYNFGFGDFSSNKKIEWIMALDLGKWINCIFNYLETVKFYKYWCLYDGSCIAMTR